MLKAHNKRYQSGMLQIGDQEKIVIPMVGLPARGKSYFSKKITRFLHWLGYSCKIFNVGNYRRQKIEPTKCTQDYFNPDNKEANKQRQEAAQDAIDDLIQFLKNGGDVAIYDGTNTTKERRKFISEQLKEKLPYSFVMFAELICDDQSIIDKNVQLTKINSPDYKGIDPEIAQKDFNMRIEQYAKVYEKIDDEEGYSFIKLYNLGKKYEINKITGYLPCKILSFIFHYHVYQRPIYLARAGKVDKVEEVLGGDWNLGDTGKQFSKNLNQFFQQEYQNEEERKKITILTSTKRSAIETSSYLNLGANVLPMKCLDELDFGTVDGLELEEIKQKYPEIHEKHLQSKIEYRYPNGESFLDLIQRLEPVIFEIERTLQPVLVISHSYMLKALYCYFESKDYEEVMSTNIKTHCLVKLIPDVNDCEEYIYDLSDEQNLEKIKEQLSLKQQKQQQQLQQQQNNHNSDQQYPQFTADIQN